MATTSYTTGIEIDTTGSTLYLNTTSTGSSSITFGGASNGSVLSTTSDGVNWIEMQDIVDPNVPLGPEGTAAIDGNGIGWISDGYQNIQWTANTVVSEVDVSEEELEVKKELHAYVLGPLFRKYLEDEGVTELLVNTVRKCVSKYARLPGKKSIIHFPKPVIIKLLEGDELLLETPTIDKILEGKLTVTDKEYLFSHFNIVAREHREKFIRSIDEELVRLALEGPDSDEDEDE